jgi:hypothetical protein
MGAVPAWVKAAGPRYHFQMFQSLVWLSGSEVRMAWRRGVRNQEGLEGPFVAACFHNFRLALEPGSCRKRSWSRRVGKFENGN